MKLSNETDDKAFIKRCLKSHFSRLPLSLRQGVPQPGGKPSKCFPFAIPADMWAGKPDKDGLVKWEHQFAKPGDFFMAKLPGPGAPPLYKTYLRYCRVCHFPVRCRGIGILLPPTPTHRPVFTADRYWNLYGDFATATQYVVFSTTHDGTKLVCFDRKTCHPDGDSPVVVVPLEAVYREMKNWRRAAVAPFALPLANSFREFLAETCLTETADWSGSERCPFDRKRPTSDCLPAFRWDRYLQADPGPDRQAPVSRQKIDSTLVDVHLERIAAKVAALRQADPAFLIPGSEYHQYQMNPVLLREELRAFEKLERFSTPPVFGQFLLNVGNGGIGPHEWLYDLQVSSAAWLPRTLGSDRVDRGRLGQPFPLRKAWRPKSEREGAEGPPIGCEDPRPIRGTVLLTKLTIRRYRALLLLVVTGAEKGHLWIDDRQRGRGVYPFFRRGPFSFLAWYEDALDHLLSKIDNLYSTLAHRTLLDFERVRDDAFRLTPATIAGNLNTNP